MSGQTKYDMCMKKFTSDCSEEENPLMQKIYNWGLGSIDSILMLYEMEKNANKLCEICENFEAISD